MKFINDILYYFGLKKTPVECHLAETQRILEQHHVIVTRMLNAQMIAQQEAVASFRQAQIDARLEDHPITLEQLQESMERLRASIENGKLIDAKLKNILDPMITDPDEFFNS